MKTLFTLLAATAVALISCKDDNKAKQLDPNAMVSLRAVTAKATKANPQHLSAREIVEQTSQLKWFCKSLQENNLSRGFAPHQRDLTNERLLMYGTDIIRQNGEYEIDFIKGEDMVLTKAAITNDTLAYIPNAVLRSADLAIKAAYDAGDYATCYTLFDQAFIFIPITGEEWRALKAEGKN